MFMKSWEIEDMLREQGRREGREEGREVERRNTVKEKMRADLAEAELAKYKEKYGELS